MNIGSQVLMMVIVEYLPGIRIAREKHESTWTIAVMGNGRGSGSMKKKRSEMTELEKLELYLDRAQKCLIISVICYAIAATCGIVAMCILK